MGVRVNVGVGVSVGMGDGERQLNPAAQSASVMHPTIVGVRLGVKLIVGVGTTTLPSAYRMFGTTVGGAHPQSMPQRVRASPTQYASQLPVQQNGFTG